MLNVSGTAQVYKVMDRNKFVTASLRQSKKNKQTDEWESEWFTAKFIGNCKDQASRLSDKDKITITKAVLEQRKHEGKEYISVVIFEFTSGTVESYHGENIKCPDCGAPLEDGMCSNPNCLPF